MDLVGVSIPILSCSPRDVFNLPLHEYPLVIEVRSSSPSSTANPQPNKIFTARILDLTRPPTVALATHIESFLRAVWDEDPPEHFGTPVVYTQSNMDITPVLVALASTTFRSFKSILHLQGGYEAFHREYPFLTLPLDAPMVGMDERFFPSDVPLDGVEGVSENAKLYLGGAISAGDAQVLAWLGITHVLNVTREVRDPPERFERIYMRIEIDDADREDIVGAARDAIPFVHGALVKGGRVLVHCQQGKSRSVAIVVMYLMEKARLTAKEAMDIVGSARTGAQPNQGFWKQLVEWEAGGKE
ncbi:protein-tyrosine phosphatase-like protein [Endogone sp. FLAS-F59071]|nr:protein-tyrosine phosphatase-like protein [Endogone sp. FLAS-F59071]|eukprot:RUS15790.1 protein-tyrosine phosphatase-like protein [Endogone sp. FLAS-F59071]